MISIMSKVLVSVAAKFFYAFFTEKLLSKMIVEMLRMVARKTTNTLDDTMVEEVASNHKG